jgi:hypothetical protein
VSVRSRGRSGGLGGFGTEQRPHLQPQQRARGCAPDWGADLEHDGTSHDGAQGDTAGVQSASAADVEQAGVQGAQAHGHPEGEWTISNILPNPMVPKNVDKMWTVKLKVAPSAFSYFSW